MKLLNMQILSLNPRPKESEALGMGPSNLITKSPPGDSNKNSSLKITIQHLAHTQLNLETLTTDVPKLSSLEGGEADGKEVHPSAVLDW